MRIRWLGWAGVEIEADGGSLVIDPLGDTNAVFAPLGSTPESVEQPRVVAATNQGESVAGLVTHLHRDHTDAAALHAALATDAPLLRPAPGGGSDTEELGLAQAEAELAAHGFAERSRYAQAWDSFEAGPFAIAALPAADGAGDPQVSWAVEADGVRAIHCGDTLFHGWWWRAAMRHGPFDIALLPINGAVLDLPHRQPASPLPAAMTPEEAALAGELLGARTVVPIHYGGYGFEPYYRPVPDAERRVLRAAAGKPFDVRVLDPGEELEVTATTAVA